MKVKFSRCNSNDLTTLDLVDGQLIYVKDTNEHYLDVGTARHKISDVIFVDNEESLDSLEDKLPNKIYYVQGTKKLLHYNGADFDTLNEIDVSSTDIEFTATDDITADTVQEAIISVNNSVKSNTSSISTIQQQISNILTKNTEQDTSISSIESQITQIESDVEDLKDNTLSKTTVLPVMDGEASIGTDEGYALGDHVHPTDTTRASVEDLNTHTSNTDNPHSVTKEQVGLGNVDNTSDLEKPISTAVQTELNSINNNITSIETDITMVKSNIDTIETNLNTVETDLDTVETDVSNLKNSVAEVEDDIDSINTTVSSHTTKLDTIEEGANRITVDTALSTTSNNPVSNSVITAAINSLNEGGAITYEEATQTASGLMSAADKTKLDSLENYVLPVATSETLGGVKQGNNVTIAEDGTLSVELNNESITIEDATQEKSGLMSATDKTKLDSLSNYDDTEIKQSITTLESTVSQQSTTIESVQTDLSNKVDKETDKGLSTNDYTTTEKEKLANIEENANNYTLPVATTDTLGGIKAGSNVSIESDGTLNVTDTTYTNATTEADGLMSKEDKVKLDGLDNYDDTEIKSQITTLTSSIENKVDKVSGKDLSTNDYTTEEKEKLAGITEGATKVAQSSTNGNILINDSEVTVYTQPTLTSSEVITALGYTPSQTDTTYEVATTSTNGLMSSTDKTKLDGIETGATANTASSTTPLANGTATVGTEDAYARGDHVHPLQTTVSGNAGTATRLATARTITLTGDVTGSTTFDGSANSSITTTITDIDASLITSGTIDISRLPAAALERCVVVANDTARYALTDSDVQLGDTVKVTDTNIMYMVTDLDNLSNDNGYTEYAAGHAATADSATTAESATTATTATSASRLTTARTINGTSFDGSANITTSSWGTSRSIYIQDSTGANTGSAVSVDGSANATLRLPATIAASLSGNATTATTLATARTIALSGGATGTATSFNGSANITIPVTSIDASYLTGTASINTTGNAATATTATSATSATSATTATTATNATNVAVTVTNPTSSTTYRVPFHTNTDSTSNLGLLQNNGLRYITLEGTTSTAGTAALVLGNATASGTAANKTGTLRLYSASTGYVTVQPTSSSSNYTITLPGATTTLVGTDTSQSLTNKTYNGYTLAAACARAVDTSISASSSSTNLPTSAAVASFVEGKGYVTSNTNYYPTTWTWTNGTSSGPTASLTGSGMSAVSVAAIPSASGTTQSGIVTTGAQTFGGVKTFSSAPVLSTNTITTSSGNTVTIPDAASTLVNLSTSQALTNKTYNGYTLAAACARGVDTSITSSSTSTNVPTSAAVATLVSSLQGCTTQTTSLTCTLPDDL